MTNRRDADPSRLLRALSRSGMLCSIPALRHRRVLFPAGAPECSHPTCVRGRPCVQSISPEAVRRETLDTLESA